MAETKIERAPESRPFVAQIVRPNPSMDVDRKFEHLAAEVNRSLALLSTQLNELRDAIAALQKKG